MNFEELTKQALQHGLSSIEEAGGPLTPFTLLLDASDPDLRQHKLSLTRHVADYLEDALVAAQASIVPNSGFAMYAIAWDGFITVDGKKWDAILVESAEATNRHGAIYAQRYETKEVGFLHKRRRNVAVGAPLQAQFVQSRLWNA